MVKLKPALKDLQTLRPVRYPEPMQRSAIGFGYGRVTPKRPTVVRRGDTVKKCFYYDGLHQCLGTQCYWPTVGKCEIYNRLFANTKGGKIASKKHKHARIIAAR